MLQPVKKEGIFPTSNVVKLCRPFQRCEVIMRKKSSKSSCHDPYKIWSVPWQASLHDVSVAFVKSNKIDSRNLDKGDATTG